MAAKLTHADASSKYGMFLTVRDLTDLLKVSRYVADHLLKSRHLPAAKLGGQYRVRTDDFFNGGTVR